MFLRARPPEPQDGDFQITENGDIIMVVLHGRMTGRVIRALSTDITRRASALKMQGRRPVVFVDASTLRFGDSVSSGRAEGRQMLNTVPVESWAVLGRARIGALVEYVGRAAGFGDKMRYFSDKNAAYAWLRGKSNPKPPSSSRNGPQDRRRYVDEAEDNPKKE